LEQTKFLVDLVMEQLNGISLAFRCPKAFNKLKPCSGGWYCNGCHKLVHDFRGKPENEIQLIFNAQGENLCGLFEADRIQISTALPKWRKWLSAAVLAIGFTGLHQTLMAQQLSKSDSLALTEPKASTINSNDIFGVMEEPASFPGGLEKFRKYIATHLVPDASCAPGLKGFFTFVVEKDGRLTDIKIIRSPFSAKMNRRVIKMFENSPTWKPGMQIGKAVRSQFTMPIVPVAK
jgi:hypothetical protein